MLEVEGWRAARWVVGGVLQGMWERHETELAKVGAQSRHPGGWDYRGGGGPFVWVEGGREEVGPSLRIECSVRRGKWERHETELAKVGTRGAVVR